ncbi:MAG: GTP-binding protein [Nitrospira sp.]|nr:GTP-binding protein [Nitrospira sp.]
MAYQAQAPVPPSHGSQAHTSTGGAVPAPAGGIPALVVSGFLGAGKTTLVRHLLREAQADGIRLAVVSNEFGDLGIDRALLGDQVAGSHYVELEGGCVCCRLSDALVTTLQRIWEDVRPDRVVVETSGVALPFDTLLNFWREPVAAWVGACLSVVVVNAEQVADGRELEGTFEQQVSSADLLILNKVDLVDAGQRDPVQARVQHMAEGTPIVRAVNAHVSTLALFPPDPGSLSRRVRSQSQQESHTHEAFEAEECVVEHGIKPDVLIHRIQSRRALRAKGFVQTSDGLRLVQGVGPRVDLMEPVVRPPDHLLGRLVLIRKSHACDAVHEHHAGGPPLQG